MMEQQTFIEDHHYLGLAKGQTVSGSGDTCYKSRRPELDGLALGKLLWAKAVLSSWWPAQIVDDRAVSENNIINQRIRGGVLVRFYGSYDFAWVDPLAELSQFEESFKGKSFNTRIAFQKALEDALLQNKTNSHEKRDGRLGCSINPSEQNQSGGSCIANSNGDFGWKLEKTSKDQPARKASSCKRKKGDEHEQIRSPRKRKEKVPFKEEETVTVASEQKGRQMKVMRHLGLAAPPGSPFSADSPVKIAA